jgi:hypothetical protein
VCTNNPFYVVSAGLFLVGLRISFGEQVSEVNTWALMSGLGGYTLLLAVTACLLVRFAKVWDDVRTVLLLVVLMFLATSVTFDDVLVANPERGHVCYLAGLLFAVAVSEAVLRGIRLKLPALFRVPYYLTLALFFLYPLALSPLVNTPDSEELMWGLFGFSSAAGLVFLTLLPAVRRGRDYVRDNGSPWPWPLYPWALFGVLGFAVPARAFLLCASMHLVGADLKLLIFGPYFLVPFGLAIAVLLLEGGLRTRGPALRAALAAPVGLVLLALVGHRADPVYRGFLATFTTRLGGDPLQLTLLAVAGFYAYAALRRAPLATEGLTGALVALAFVGPHTMLWGDLSAPQPLPILAAAALQLGLGLWGRVAWRCVIGAGGLAAFATLALPAEFEPMRKLIGFHLGLLAVMIVGLEFDDSFGRVLRSVAAVLILAACLAGTLGTFKVPAGVPAWALAVYPLGMATLLAGYGWVLRHRTSQVLAGLAGVAWLIGAGWHGYVGLRQLVTGLDHIVLSLAFLVVAILISLGKAGVLARWLPAWAKNEALEVVNGLALHDPEVEPLTPEELASVRVVPEEPEVQQPGPPEDKPA